MTRALENTDELNDLVLSAEGVTRARTPGKGVQSFRMVDPLASEMPSYSPYAYGFNNPIRFTDPTGMAPEEEPCCDFGAAAQELKKVITEKLPEAASTLANLVGSGLSAIIPDEGSTTDPSGSRDQGEIDGTGVETMNPEGDFSPRAAGNGPSTPDAKGGSTGINEYGKGDTPSGGGGTKSGGKHQQPSKIIKRTSKVKNSVKTYQRATAPNSTKPDTTFVRRQGRFRHGETDTIIRS